MNYYKYTPPQAEEQELELGLTDFSECLIGYFADVDHPNIYI